jgi:hypothetical protein
MTLKPQAENALSHIQIFSEWLPVTAKILSFSPLVSHIKPLPSQNIIHLRLFIIYKVYIYIIYNLVLILVNPIFKLKIIKGYAFFKS